VERTNKSPSDAEIIELPRALLPREVPGEKEKCREGNSLPGEPACLNKKKYGLLLSECINPRRGDPPSFRRGTLGSLKVLIGPWNLKRWRPKMPKGKRKRPRESGVWGYNALKERHRRRGYRKKKHS